MLCTTHDLFAAAGLGACALAAFVVWLAHKRCLQDKRLRFVPEAFTIKRKQRKESPMPEITLSIKEYAELRLVPRDLTGQLVSLDAGALKVIPLNGGTSRITEAMEDVDAPPQLIRVFTVAFIPGEIAGPYAFTLRGDALPGTGEEFIEETLIVNATPERATTFGLAGAVTTFTRKPKSELPPLPEAAPVAEVQPEVATPPDAATPQ